MFRLCKPLFAAGLLLIVLAPGDRVRAQDGSCGGGYASCSAGCNSCGGCGHVGALGRLGAWFNYQPYVGWYAPYPYWWPHYFGPPYTDYQLVQYVAPPVATALMVRERIQAINSANPALLPFAVEPLPLPKEPLPKEQLPFPKRDKKPEEEKEPPVSKLP
jgi:hypothetical protein